MKELKVFLEELEFYAKNHLINDLIRTDNLEYPISKPSSFIKPLSLLEDQSLKNSFDKAFEALLDPIINHYQEHIYAVIESYEKDIEDLEAQLSERIN